MIIAQLCPTPCDLMDCSPPGSSVHGILQARILDWVAIPFSRGSTWRRDWTWVCSVAGRFPEPPGKPLLLYPEMSRSPTSDFPWCWTNSHCSLSLHFAWPVNSAWRRSRSLFTLHITSLSHHIPLDPFRLPGGSQSVSLAVSCSFLWSQGQGLVFEPLLFSRRTHSLGGLIHSHHPSPGPSLSPCFLPNSLFPASSQDRCEHLSLGPAPACSEPCWAPPHQGQGKGPTAAHRPHVISSRHLAALISPSSLCPSQTSLHTSEPLHRLFSSPRSRVLLCPPPHFLQTLAQLLQETVSGHYIYNFRASRPSPTSSSLFLTLFFSNTLITPHT